MKIVCCNRCGKDITNKPKYKFDVRWKGLKGNGICYAVPSDEDKQSEMDICVDCYNDFKNFIDIIKE